MAEVGGFPGNLYPPVVESLLLSVAAWWRLTHNKNIQIDLIGRNFQQDDVTAAMFSLRSYPGYVDLVGHIERRQQGNRRSAIYAQAQDLVELLDKLDDAKKLPRFVLHCEDLNRATSIMGGLGVRDERAVSARLESLEVGMRKVMEAVQQQGAAGRAERSQTSFLAVPKVVVTAPAGGAGATLAGTAAPGGPGARRQVQGGRRASQSGPRDLSPSQKRARTEEQEARPREESPWIKVVKKPRKTAVGKSSIDLEAIGVEAEAGPIEMYISNTSNKSDNDAIKKVLETSAANIDISLNFKVTKVELLTKEANPRTKCYKVTVPFKHRELMENEELYPAGWRYRKFYSARNIRNKSNISGVTSEKNTVAKEVQVLNKETMAAAILDARLKLAQLEAQSAGQEVASAPAMEGEASPASAAAPAGGREGAGTAQ